MAETIRVADAIPLPDPGELVTGRAAREDAYPIVVCRTFEAAIAPRGRVARRSRPSRSSPTTSWRRSTAGLISGLREAGKEPLMRVIPAGEASKSLEQAVAAWHWLAASDIARRDVLVAFGGGVVADLGGWVASGYMRGIPYVNVPTTLLAQVDGALGGKVAANHPAREEPARRVPLAGRRRGERRASCARTSGRHLRAGLAEAIKKAVIASPAYWRVHRGARGRAARARRRARSSGSSTAAAAIKTALIERDPYERDLRRPLNFGHTIGHPLETVTGYGPLLHGEAVAFGMVVEARIASRARPARRVDARAAARSAAALRRCRPTAADLPVVVDGRRGHRRDGEGAPDPRREPALRAAGRARRDRHRRRRRRGRGPRRARRLRRPRLRHRASGDLMTG